MKKLVLYCIIFFKTILMQAQWSADPGNPLALCNVSGNQTQPVTISDGNNGVYSFWIDARSGFADAIYGQHLNADGVTLWGTNGKEILHTTGASYSKIHAVLSNNKILVGWLFDANGNGYDTLYAQKLDDNGDLLWNEKVAVAGNNLSAGGAYGGIVNFTMLSKDDGCYFAFIPTGYGYNYIAINRIDGNGNILWGYNGKFIEGLNAGYPALVPDGVGGAYVTWLNGNFFSQRFNEDSTLLWSSKKNMTGCTGGSGGTYADFTYFTTVSDEANGFVAAWTSANADIYVSRTDSNGNDVWPCVSICNESHSQEQVALVKQGNAFYVAWVDSRPEAPFFMQKIDMNGNAKWTTNGVLVDNPSIYIPVIKLAASDSGSVVLFYQTTSNGFDAQKINSDSTHAWSQPLQVLLNPYQPFYQLYDLVSIADGDVIGVAETGGNSGDQNIHAFSIDAYIVTGVKEILYSEDQMITFPNPANENITLKFPGNFSCNKIDLLDVRGRFITSFPANGNSVAILDVKNFPEGYYLLQVQDGKRILRVKILIAH